MKKYKVERDGQIDFFNQFQIDYNNNEVLIDNTDGVYNGNLIEFKLNILDPNKVLFQAIKYLSNMRIKGESVPATILCIDLNDTLCYVYSSQDYFEDIHKVYFGSASKDNEGFISNIIRDKIDYSTQEGASTLKKYLNQCNYMKIRIDEDCIVGWAERYYREYPTADKGDFLDDREGLIINKTSEIREPKVFKNYILPYTGKTNEKFKYLMDKLNDKRNKKKLGAFYTPIPYCNLVAELLRKAISRVPNGNDYVIIDRCAGTGNLQSVLTDEELSHCIVSTMEYYEYKVLLERLGNKVREVIPPIESQVEYINGCVSNADALSEQYINNTIIKKYLDDNKCTIILLENPPYTESNGTTQTAGDWKKSYVYGEMKNEISGSALNDLANAFIWSGFKYYMREETDSYLLFSPAKYWKIHHLVNKKYLGGFAFNRRHFHTKIDACIIATLYANIDEQIERFNVQAYDIDANAKLVDYGELPIEKIYKTYASVYGDKRKFEDDEQGIFCDLQGDEIPFGNTARIKAIYNKNILAYMVVNQSGFDNPDLNSGLTTIGRYDGNGFYVRNDNYIEKLPLFCASRYITYNRQWTERARIMKSGDSAEKYLESIKKDDEFKKECLIFTCLEMQNHCKSFIGSDGRLYQNNFCLDDNSFSYNELKKYDLNNDDKSLINAWEKVLEEARKTKKYDKRFKYGVYQISKELNTFHKNEDGDNIPDYPELNGNLSTLKNRLKKYYINIICKKLFEYELLK